MQIPTGAVACTWVASAQMRPPWNVLAVLATLATVILVSAPAGSPSLAALIVPPVEDGRIVWAHFDSTDSWDVFTMEPDGSDVFDPPTGRGHPHWTPACVGGTPNADVLSGTPGNDFLCGYGGNAMIDGLDGRDVILGGAGADRIFGRAGREVLNGGSGPDRLLGGEGADSLPTFDGTMRNDRADGGLGSSDVCLRDLGDELVNCEILPRPGSIDADR